MKATRIIPRLDIKGPNLVKGIHLEGLRVLGLPERFSNEYFHEGCDELLYIDSVASLYGRNNLKEIVERTAKNVFVPLTVGGGIRSVDDIRGLLRAGADKIAINTAAIRNPQLIAEGAKVFGSQCIVVSIQAMSRGNGTYEAYTDNAREPTGLDVCDWAKEAVALGAGEVLITSIDREGIGMGYDLDFVSKVGDAVDVPVIACGGAGCAEHMKDLLNACKVDAVCAASIFHYHVIRKFGVEKRDNGNVEYLKKFVTSHNPVLKRITPISVSDLKRQLSDATKQDLHRKPQKAPRTDADACAVGMKPRKQNPSPKIALVDYGRSNLFSVEWALEKIGATVEMTSDPESVRRADKLIIAGVGAFGDGMLEMRRRHLSDAVLESARAGKPILGICLGMQLFMTHGEEFGIHEGLNLVRGRCVKLSRRNNGSDVVKVPHIGWNQIGFPRDDPEGRRWSRSRLLKGVSPQDCTYFVHSYAVVPADSSCIAAETEYGPNTFCSVLVSENVMGCQFHPERSGYLGLRVYENFIRA